MTLRGRDRGANTRQHNDPASGWAAGTAATPHQAPNELVRAYPPGRLRLDGLFTVMPVSGNHAAATGHISQPGRACR